MRQTKKDLILALKAIIQRQKTDSFDPECDHVDADELLLAYINDPDVTKTFNDIEKWYA
jgi:hypothetical protein